MIVGLDLSLTGTGMTRFDLDGKFKSWNVGTSAKQGTDLERYRKIVLHIMQNSKASDTFFIEDYAYSVRGGKLATMGELGGIVKTYLWRRSRMEPFPVPQSILCKWFNKGVGSCKKDMKPVAILQNISKRELKTHDEYISFALTDLGWHMMNLPIIKRGDLRKDGYRKFELDILSELQKTYGHILNPMRDYCHNSFHTRQK